MRVVNIVLLLSALSLSFQSAWAAPELEKKRVTFSIGEWAPYTSEVDPKYLEVVMKEVFALSGYVVEFGYYPWKRSYERTRNGRSVATFPWFIDKDREDHLNFILPKESILQETEVFFYRNNTAFDWRRYSDLAGLKVGGVIGYSHVTRLQKEGISLNVVSSEKQIFLMLAAGRLDIVPATKTVGSNIIKNYLSEDQQALITFHPKPLMQDKMYVFFSRKHPRGQFFSEVYDRGMKVLKASGRLDEIACQVNHLSCE